MAFGTVESENELVSCNNMLICYYCAEKPTQDDHLQNKEDPWKRQSAQSVECGILRVFLLNLFGSGEINDAEYKISQQRGQAEECRRWHGPPKIRLEVGHRAGYSVVGER